MAAVNGQCRVIVAKNNVRLSLQANGCNSI